jgi:hypothetical protein
MRQRHPEQAQSKILVMQKVVKGQVVLKHEEIEDEIHIIHNKIGIIETILERLENNHLMHIEKDVDKLTDFVKEVNGRLWGIMAIALVQICGLAGALFFMVMDK